MSVAWSDRNEYPLIRRIFMGSFGFAENLIWQVGLLIGLSSVSKTNKANVVQIPSPRDHGFGWLSCAASRGRRTFCCKFEDQISQEIRRSSNFVCFQSNFPPKRGLKSIQIPGLFKVRIVACADGVRRRALFSFLFWGKKESSVACASWQMMSEHRRNPSK